MTSNDNQQYITVEMFNETTNRIETQIINLTNQQQASFRELKNETSAVRDIAIVNSTKIDDLYHFMSIGFTILAIVIAFIGFVITLAPMFRDMYKDSKQAKKHDDMKQVAREIIKEEMTSAVSKTVDEAISKVLGNLRN